MRLADSLGDLPAGTAVALRTVGLADVREARVLPQLADAHVALAAVRSQRVLTPVAHGQTESGTEPEFWSAAPLCDGRTLADVLESTEIVPDMLAEAVIGQVCEGVAAVHAAGLHGLGLSPDSVLLRSDGTASLLDAGFGPAVVASWPAEGAAPVSMLCAAPEVLRGGPVDARADLFSLGAILFRCMTGRWHRPAEAETLLAHAHEMDGSRPADERAKCSTFLSEVTYALIRPNPATRIADAGDLLLILKERRKSAWWQSLQVDGDTMFIGPPVISLDAIADETVTDAFADAPEPEAEPGPAPIPGAAEPPDEAWWQGRVRMPEREGVPASRCVGRDDAISLLAGSTMALAERGGHVVLVEGAEGTGKSRVVDAFLERLAGLPEIRRPIVLRGFHRCAGVGRPFGAFTEALTRFLGDGRLVRAETVAPLLRESAGVAAAFAAVVSSEAPPDDAPALDHANVLPAFLRCIRTLCERAPVVLVAEDLHWADPEGLQLFAYLSRVAGDLPLLLVATVRTDLTSGSAAEALDAVRALPGTRSVHLLPLDDALLAQLAREMVGPPDFAAELAAHVSAHSGGVPGALVETLRALADELRVNRDGTGALVAACSLADAQPPASLGEALDRRLAAIGPAERRLLDVASVQGVAFDAEVARIAAGFDVRTAAEVLGDLSSRGMLVGDDVARSFASHALFERVTASLAGEDLREHHAATAAAFLASRNPDHLPPSRIHGILSFRLAWHYLQSGHAARSLPYIRAAVEHLAGTCRHGDGERLTALACAVLENDAARSADHVDLLLARAGFLAEQGRTEEQRASLSLALRCARARRDLLRESRVLFESARLHFESGRASDADDEARQALSCAHRSGESEVEMRVHLWLARTALRQSRWQDARVHWTEALELARRRADEAVASDAQHGLGLVAQALGSFDQAEDCFRQALHSNRRRHDLLREAETLTCLASLASAAGDLASAEEQLRRAQAIRLALGDGTGETRVLGLLAMVLQEGGDFVAALEAHRACLERARRIDARHAEVVALLNLATVATCLGRLDEARDAYGDALRCAGLIADARLSGYAFTGLGEVARQRGDDDLAAQLLGRAEAQFRSTQEPLGLAAALLALGRLDALAGRSDEARTALAEVEHLAEQQHARQITAVAAALGAVLSARGGDADDAERRIALSGLALSDIRASYATRVEALFLQSLALRVLGRPVEANRRLLQAEATAEESLARLDQEDRDRVVETLTPYREIFAGASATRTRTPPKTRIKTDTVQV